MLKRQYLGFEIVKEYYEFAKERLEKNIYRIKEIKETKKQAQLTFFDRGERK
jgi:DNA modification methylase